MSRARLTTLVTVALALGCRAAPIAPPPAPAEGSAIIELHADLAGPTEVAVGSTLGVSEHGLRNFGKGTRTTVDAFPARLECPLYTACMVGIRGVAPRSATLFAFDRSLAVELVAASEDAPSELRYRDPTSTSATLARIHAAAEALGAACKAGDPAAQSAAEEVLRRLRAEPDALIRDAARLAWLATQCADPAEQLTVATATLDELAADSPVVGLWPQGVAIAGTLLSERGTAKLVEIALAQPNPDVGGMVLVIAHARAFERGDATTAADVVELLESPRFVENPMRAMLYRLGDESRRFLVDVGDPFPRLTGTQLGTGEPVDTDAMRGRPILVYLTSISCGGCTRNLPSLRTFATEHPDVQILVVTLDEQPGAARRLADQHAPLPGVVVDNEPSLRTTVTASLMNPLVFPSFVLVDADGKVRATSLSLELPELDAASGWPPQSRKGRSLPRRKPSPSK